ncbi:hypothetical protein RRF57_006349 [Xylaria bambusicola]|uniref:Pectate lyase n=1 Tax=Xylaria bambusicola TaxID=326684 RepID=A0AAN7UZ86_9PEZI
MYECHVILDGIAASDGSSLVAGDPLLTTCARDNMNGSRLTHVKIGINSDYGDTATFSNVIISDIGDICVEYEGNDTGDESEKISSGPSDYCGYDNSDVTES